MLTKEKSLIIFEKILIDSSKRYLNVMKKLVSEGEVNITLDNPKVARRIGELNVKLEKKKIIENEGINLEPDSPTDVFGKVTQTYKDNDEEYSRKL